MHHEHILHIHFLKFLLRRYYYYLIIGIAITLLQIIWGYYVLYVGIETIETSVLDATGKKPLLRTSGNVNPLFNKDNTAKWTKNYAEFIVQNYSVDNDKHQECIINGKDALSALRRAKTEECKAKIRSLACNTEKKDFFAKRLSNSCPSNGNVKGRRLGCYIDNRKDRILKGFNTRLIHNHPNLCGDICLQRGYIYAGVEYSNECFCGNEELPTQMRVPQVRCNMTCSGRLTEPNCGGYLAIDILNTGLAKVVPYALQQSSDGSEPEVRIAFILTVNGRSVRQIHRLIKALYSTRHFFYIHVDSRQHYLFTELLKLEESFSNIYLSRNRLSSIWGGASLLTVLLNSMKELLQKEWQWNFIINLSESDYPIKKVSDLTTFLTANRDRNFLKSHGQNTNSFLRKQGLDRTFLECDHHMWRMGERKLPLGIRMDGGSDWLCLGRKFVEFVVFSENKMVVELKKLFSFTLLPAESFFHTVLRNSELCHTFTDNNLHLTNWIRKLGCRCQYKDVVDWCGCSPNDFVLTDWPKIQAAGKRNLYFGRKFEPVKSLGIINQLDEYLYEGHQSGSPGLDSHWENRYHMVDHPSGCTDAKLILYDVASRLGMMSIKSCNASLSHIMEVHTLHKNDTTQGILVKYAAKVGSVDITMEAHIIKISHFGMHLEHPFATYLKHFQINSNFDLKEQMFRNFEEALGPRSKLTAAFWWNDSLRSNERTNSSLDLTLVLVDPLGVVAAIEEINMEKEEKLVTQQLSFKNPLRPGLWAAFVVLDGEILAENVFAILPSQFQDGRRLSEKEEKDLTLDYGSSYEKKGRDHSKIIISDSFYQEISYLNMEISRELDSSTVAYAIIKRMRELNAICFAEESVPPCVKTYQKCANTKWSSLSPDPKSTLVK